MQTISVQIEQLGFGIYPIPQSLPEELKLMDIICNPIRPLATNEFQKNHIWKSKNITFNLLSKWTTTMPTLKIIDNIKIDIYSREHPPPHFHAKFAEIEELIEIYSLKTYAGRLPKVQRRKVVDWAVENKKFLLDFQQLNPRL